MKLHQDQSGALNTVTAYGSGYIEINAQKHFGGLRVQPEGEVQAWRVGTMTEFDEQAVAELLTDAPEIILLGTGDNQIFPPPSTLSQLYRSQTGFGSHVDAGCLSHLQHPDG